MIYSTQFLGQTVTVTVDRPLGSIHPETGLQYMLNYGYVDGVLAPDDDYLDAYIIGVGEPVARCTGLCIAVIHRLTDQDDKLIVAADCQGYSDEAIRELTGFQERFFHSIILRE